MTPTLPELMSGAMAAFAEPPPPEAAGDFMAGRIGVVGLISLLGAQEAERGVAARVEENRLMRALFADAAPAWDARLDGALSRAAEGEDGDLSLSALDSANAELRRTLIRLHEAADSDGARDLQGQILSLLKRSAELRALHYPAMPPR